MEKLSFDELKELIETDEEQAEEYRVALIQDFISTLPEERQQRMRAFQWRLDQEMRKIKNPLVRAQFVFGCMMDSLMKMDDTLQRTVPVLSEKLLDLQKKSSI